MISRWWPAAGTLKSLQTTLASYPQTSTGIYVRIHPDGEVALGLLFANKTAFKIEILAVKTAVLLGNQTHAEISLTTPGTVKAYGELWVSVVGVLRDRSTTARVLSPQSECDVVVKRTIRTATGDARDSDEIGDAVVIRGARVYVAGAIADFTRGTE